MRPTTMQRHKRIREQFYLLVGTMPLTRVYLQLSETQKEVGIRNRFVAVSRAVAARAKNLSTLTQDQAAFAAQKDQPGGCKTFKQWLWKVEGDSYDENHQ